MRYALVYTRRAAKDIKKLDSLTKKRLSKKLKEFEKNPLHYVEKLVNSKIGEYRFRVGNHRIVFDIRGKDIVVLRIGHRREIYE